MVTRSSAAVRSFDRLLDMTALALLVIGVGLFAHGREELGSLGDGTHAAPAGVTWVSVAERYDSQTRWGLWLAGAGLVVGTLSAAQYAARHRRQQG